MRHYALAAVVVLAAFAVVFHKPRAEAQQPGQAASPRWEYAVLSESYLDNGVHIEFTGPDLKRIAYADIVGPEVIKRRLTKLEDYRLALNAVGAQGWELSAVDRPGTDQTRVYILKRPAR